MLINDYIQVLKYTPTYEHIHQVLIKAGTQN